MIKKTFFCIAVLSLATFSFAQDFAETANSKGASIRGGGNVLYGQDGAAIGNDTAGIVATRYANLPAGADIAHAADDFTVPAGESWVISGVDTTGFSNNNAPDLYGVRIYRNDGGLPGDVVFSWTGTPSNGLDPALQEIVFDAGPTLTTGTYWLSVHGIYNNGADIAFDRWNWSTGPVQFGEEWVLEDTAAFFGGLAWTSASGLGIPDVSAAFVLRGTAVASIPTLGEWGMIAMVTILMATGVVFMRRRRVAA